MKTEQILQLVEAVSGFGLDEFESVSYTHLDVYKRQDRRESN